MTTDEERRAARDAKLDALHERLTGAVEQLVSGEDWRRALEFAARFRSRSTGRVGVFELRECSALGLSVGGVVGPGAAGVRVNADDGERVQAEDAESWRRLGRFEKPRPGEVVRTRMVGVKPAFVWDLSQTSGDPIPEPPAPVLLDGGAPVGLWDGLADLVAAEGFALLQVPDARAIGGANGVTDYRARTVSVRADMDEAARVKTLAHELGHVRLHGPDNPEATGHRGIGEVEAESVAMMIGAAHGMDTTAYTIPYVSGWAGTVKDKDPAEVVQATGERVRKAAGAILDALDTVQLGGGDPPGLTRDTEHLERPAHRAQPAAAADFARPVRTVEPAVRGL